MFRIYICIIANHFMNFTQKILIDFINFCSRSLIQRTWVEIADKAAERAAEACRSLIQRTWVEIRLSGINIRLCSVVLLYREHGLKLLGLDGFHGISPSFSYTENMGWNVKCFCKIFSHKSVVLLYREHGLKFLSTTANKSNNIGSFSYTENMGWNVRLNQGTAVRQESFSYTENMGWNTLRLSRRRP